MMDRRLVYDTEPAGIHKTGTKMRPEDKGNNVKRPAASPLIPCDGGTAAETGMKETKISAAKFLNRLSAVS